MKLPPLIFHVAYEDQPDAGVWKSFLAFAVEWNKSHSNQFKEGTGIENDQFRFWELNLKGGINDSEMEALNAVLNQLHEKCGLIWHCDVSDDRTKQEHAECPFVTFVSDGYQDEFYVNADQILTYETECDHCQHIADESGRVLDQVVIDESILTPDNEIVKKYPGRLDFVNMPNGAMLVSQRTREVLEELNPLGYVLYPVINQATGKSSERFFLLKAAKAIVDPCHEHTPRAENAICYHCGAHTNTVTGYFHVQENQLNGYEVFSINRFGFTGIYFSQRLFQAFVNRGLKEISVVHGIEVCQHP